MKRIFQASKKMSRLSLKKKGRKKRKCHVTNIYNDDEHLIIQ